MSTQQEAQERALEEYYLREHLHLPRTGSYVTNAFNAGWQAGRAPLLAKIAELERKGRQNSELFTALELRDARIAELEATHARALEILQMEGEFRDDLVAKRDRVTDLEAQNKKLGDVVLEMAKAFKLIANNCVDKVTAEDSAWVLERSADLIKQLKQERGE